MAPPYPSDDSPPQQGDNSQHYNPPQPHGYHTYPVYSFVAPRPMSSGLPSADGSAGYPSSPQQPSYAASSVRGYPYQQPVPAPAPVLYQPFGRRLGYGTPYYPGQPTYANASPSSQLPYSPQPPQSPPAAQSQHVSPPMPPPYSPLHDIKQEDRPADAASGSMPPTADGERGLMGAVLGGATGAVAGHKVNHGVLGALGGAIAGHKLEDAWKDHRKNSRPSSSSGVDEKNQWQQQRPNPLYATQWQQQQQQQRPNPLYAPQWQQQQQQPPMMASQRPLFVPVFPPVPVPSPEPVHRHEPPQFGNFSHSSSRIRLERDCDLIAECRTMSGGLKMTSISLNNCLTNMDGHFKWAGAEPGNFAHSARNVFLVDEGRVLKAELRAADGTWRWDRIQLDERITNIDGDLRMN